MKQPITAMVINGRGVESEEDGPATTLRKAGPIIDSTMYRQSCPDFSLASINSSAVSCDSRARLGKILRKTSLSLMKSDSQSTAKLIMNSALWFSWVETLRSNCGFTSVYPH